MMRIEEVAQGTKPINIMTAPDRTKPKAKNTLGFERSEMDPEINFEKP